MKIDFEMLDGMVAAGASGAVIVDYLRRIDGRREKRRAADRVRKHGGKKRKASGNGAETVRNPQVDASRRDVDETDQRGRLFGLAPRLVTLGLLPDKARTMLGQWAKITRDNVDAIAKAIDQAELKKPADAIGYIRACLQERNTINGAGNDTMAAFDRAIAREKTGPGNGNGPLLDLTPTSSRTG